MIYSYKFEDSFFEKLSEIEYNDLNEVISFFKDYIFKKENLFYFDQRNKFYSENNLNRNNQISYFKELFANKILPIGELIDKKIDYVFSNHSKIPVDINISQRKIGVDEILNAKDELIKEIDNSTIDTWIPAEIKKKILKQLKKNDISFEKKKFESLKIILKRLFKYSNKVYFVDAFLPDHIMGNNLNSFKESFKFYKSLTSNVKNVEFYHGVRTDQLKAKNKNKADLELVLKDFFKDFSNFKSNVYIKHREAQNEYGEKDIDQFNAYDKAMYYRMIITFIGSRNIAIIVVDRGLNIIKFKGTTQDRGLEKKTSKWSKSKLENDWIYVEKSNNFIKFNTGELI